MRFSRSPYGTNALAGVIGITAVAYVGLLCLMALCVPLPSAAALAGGHDHHGGNHDADTSHATFCAWACQVTSQSEVVEPEPVTISTLVASQSVDLSSVKETVPQPTSSDPRAPPSPFMV